MAVTDFLIGCLQDGCDQPAMPDGKVWTGQDFYAGAGFMLVHYICAAGHSYYVPKDQLAAVLTK